MHDTTLISQEDARRHDVRARPDRNGLDYLEVSPDQLSLTVYFLGKAPPALLKAADEDPAAYQQRLRQAVIIEGGERIRGIRVVEVDVRQARDSRTRRVRAELDDWMTVRVDRYGDFSTYTLRLVGLEGIDPFYDHVAFTFKAGCVSDLDCLPGEVCPPDAPAPVEIDYLAKDYASFRQLLLDRLSLTLPDWQERHVPDLGITLVELLAYVGDQLSYYQDAAATEAYLDTARQRISVRRHARLVDYRMHEGCNARAWLCLETDSNLTGEQALDPGQLFFITGLNEAQAENGRVLTLRDLVNLPPSSYEVFEPVLNAPLELYVAHQHISFYTWGDRQSCLPAGATRATLRDPRALPPAPPEKEPPAKGKRPPRGKKAAAAQAAQQQQAQQLQQQKQAEPTPDEPPPDTGLHLKAGDVLIFEEVLGPVTGLAEDADPRHRHAVRLTRVTYSEDTLYQPPVPVVEIEWAEEDALPFALCLSAISGPANDCRYLEDISVACGNVILVDHGRSLDWEDLGVVACESELAECDCEDRVADRAFVAARYRPRLAQSPVTFRAPYPAPAQVAGQQARALAGLLDQVHNRVVALWQQTLRGTPLSAGEIEELAVIFGSQAIHDCGLLETDSKDWRRGEAEQAAEQAAAIQELLGNADRLLQSKARRVSILLARAQAGSVQAQAEQEIGELFGAAFAGEVSATNAYALGPASQTLRQDPREALPQIELYSTPPAPAADCRRLEPLFSLHELRYPALLLHPLRDPDHFRGQVLRARLSPETQRLLTPPEEDSPDEAELLLALAADLNGLLQGWQPRSDLLDSDESGWHYVGEVNNEGRAVLRFGDGAQGRQPEAGAAFTARYRVGSGARGNVGAEAITGMVTRQSALDGISVIVRNPLPAAGGIDPEPIAEVKLFAPGAFRREKMRAITPGDYAELAEREFAGRLQQAAASLQWSGSWYEAQVVVDPLGSQAAEPALLEEISRRLDAFRRIGHDLAVRPARYVPLDVEIEVCVLPRYLRGHVQAELLRLFSTRMLPNGKPGFFHPDSLSFGSGIAVSQMVAAAQAVAGVESVLVRKFQRLDEGDQGELRSGLLALGALEVPRLDNDPNFPEHGRLALHLRGGR